LKFFCGIEADKKYQLSDWRVRPLPNELITYARQDTHHLLYIYDRLKNLLIQSTTQSLNFFILTKDLMVQVLEKSKEICKTRYEKVLWTEASYLSFLKNLTFNKQQQEMFRRLFNWRDKIARLEDESFRFVLPDSSLILISENLPKTIEKVFSLISPVPALVRKYRQEIIELIELKQEETNGGGVEKSQDQDNMESPVMQEQDKIQDLFQSSGWVETNHLNFNETLNSSDDEGDDEDMSNPRSHEKRTIEAIQESQTSSLFDDMKSVFKDDHVKSLYESFSYETIYPKKKESPEPSSPIATSEIQEDLIEKVSEDQTVPKSLNEIYNISQKKRIGNKSKKILKQEAKYDPSPAYEYFLIFVYFFQVGLKKRKKLLNWKNQLIL
jgi:ribonuclease D